MKCHTQLYDHLLNLEEERPGLDYDLIQHVNILITSSSA